jgi:hypothetical protein
MMSSIEQKRIRPSQNFAIFDLPLSDKFALWLYSFFMVEAKRDYPTLNKVWIHGAEHFDRPLRNPMPRGIAVRHDAFN